MKPLIFCATILAIATAIVFTQPLREFIVLLGQVLASAVFILFILAITLEAWSSRRKN